jgi:tagatose 6-phosphate kinase
LKANVIATGILAGHYGKYFIDLLNHENIKHDFYMINHDNTRICVNISGDKDHSQSELLEPGPRLTKNDLNKFMKHFKNVINGATLVSIAGGIPKGIESNIYQKLIKICKNRKIKVFVDTSGESLKHALLSKPDFVKPNVDEIAQLLNKTNFSVEEAIEFARTQVKNGIKNFVLSLGSKGAILITRNESIHALPPKHKVINTVGCGDTLVAGFIFAEVNNYSSINKIEFATALSTAASLTLGTAEVHLKDLLKCQPKLKV